MAQQIINNGETGLVVRNKLNDNFTELYSGLVNPYPRVTAYADLPTASSATGLIYVVETSTGIWPFRRSAGMWLSNGVNWSWLGNEALIAEQITFFPAGTISSLNVQDAIEEVANESAPSASGMPVGGSTGQVLTKDSGADYDVSWQTPSGGGGSVPSFQLPMIIKPDSGAYIGNVFHTAIGTQATVANEVIIAPVIFGHDFTTDQVYISVSASGSGIFGRVVIFSSDADGRPTTALLTSGPLDFTTTGSKMVAITGSLALQKNKVYWVGMWTSGVATLRTISTSNPVLSWSVATTPIGNNTLVKTVTYSASGSVGDWGTYTNSQLNTRDGYLVMLRTA